jgi:DUF1680 family protein
MKLFFLFAAAVASSFGSWTVGAGNLPRDFAVSPVSVKDVQFARGFWAERLATNRAVTIPNLLTRFGNAPDLRLLEAVCDELEQVPDPQLRARLDATLDDQIALIRRLEHSWPNDGDGSLYNAGTFLETAVAYFEATGSRKLLDVAIEVADDLDANFGPEKRRDISSREGVEIGLERLYRCTGDNKYLRLAQFFVDTRGNPEHRGRRYGPFAQDDQPIIKQTRAVGNAVRATSLYAALTDLVGLTGNEAYWKADERLWEDAMSRRIFLTGGLGARRADGAFGDDYELPNAACWNETCAACGNALWNWRMSLLTQDARYADMLEQTLYNAVLAGVSRKGDQFLYQAPLQAFAGFGRQSWFGPNCCPPEVARLLAQLGGLVYARNENSLYVNLYADCAAKIMLAGQEVRVSQETKYPWDGDVKIWINPPTPAKFAVYARIPGWAQGNGWPTGLYRNLPLPESEQGYSIVAHVGGADYPVSGQTDKGYVKIESEWKQGDWIELKFKMPVRRVAAAAAVADDRGRVALMRGPLIYCLERKDNPAGVFNLMLPENAGLQFNFHPELMGGTGTIVGEAQGLSRGPDQVAVLKQARAFTAIPYYAFANRDRGEMEVWMAAAEDKAELAPAATIASTSRASSSCNNGSVAENYPKRRPPSVSQRAYPLSQDGSGDIRAIQSQREPVNSEDGSGTFLRLRPQTGSNVWVQYDFAQAEKVSAVAMYWKDDKQYCVPPESWRLLYREGTEWKEVQTFQADPVQTDKFNQATFQPVTTTALRLEIKLQERKYKKGELGPPDANYLTADETWYEGGLIEWRINP